MHITIKYEKDGGVVVVVVVVMAIVERIKIKGCTF